LLNKNHLIDVEKINPITEELQDLGSMLGKFPSVTPYQAPAGYFAGFPSLMYSLVSENLVAEKELPETLKGITTAYQVPGRYFDSLPQTIMQKIRESASAGADLPGAARMASEEDAFAELSSLSPLLSGISKKSPFEVPENYFAELSDKLISGTRSSGVEVREAQVSAPVQAKVVTGMFRRRVLQYAAAAVVSGLVITAGFFLVNRQSQDQLVSSKGLEEKTEQTSDADILNYLADQPLSVSDLQLINSEAEINVDAIPDMLADVSDEELQQYVQLQSDVKPLMN